MLKIVVDATPILPKPSGVGFYVANLIHSLDSLQTQEDFQLGIVYQPGLKNWLRGNLTPPDSLKAYTDLHVLPLPVRISSLLLALPFNPALNHFEQYFGYPDIVHGTNYSVYPCRKSLKVMSIYDLTFIKYPNYINSVVKTYAERVKHCLQWTDMILTISESSKRDIVEYLRFNPERVHVTPLASRYCPNYLTDKLIDPLEKSVIQLLSTLYTFC